MLELVRFFAIAGVLWAACLGALAQRPEAPSPAIAVEVTPGASVVEGERVVLSVTLTGLQNDPRLPVMLTPQVVGEAVEALRGRLLRADAQTAADGRVSFDLPLLARAQGSSAVTVSVVSFDCRATCREVTLRATVPIDVRLPR